MRLKIHYLTHNEIDKQKWDLAIKSSFNGQLHAYSWYLDIVCENWDALIEGDYQRVMPLPWKRKYRQPILYSPLYCGALGVFSIDKIDQNIVDQFLHSIPRRFRYVSVWFNKFNKIEHLSPQQLEIESCEIDLICEYPRIFEGFTQKTQDILTDVAQEQFTIRRKIPTLEFMTFMSQHIKVSEPILKQDIVKRLNTLISALSKYGIGETIAINDGDNKLLAAGFFVSHQNKASVLLLASYKISASYLIIDEFIRTYIMKNITLEFPQPQSPDEKELFEAFGSTHSRSVIISKNKFPFPLRYFVKF